MDERLIAFGRLLGIMDDLREKCPWDRKQTISTLRKLTIEETYELSDAIIAEDWKSIREELGDIFLHLVFYSKIGEEKGAFGIGDVLEGINKKLVFRHPHIFGDVTVQDAREVEQNWEKIKLTEHQDKTVLGVRALADIIREESREAISRLKSMGVRCMMLTGDNRYVAKWVAEDLGLDDYFAEVLPHQQARDLHRGGEGRGDGVEDVHRAVLGLHQEVGHQLLGAPVDELGADAHLLGPPEVGRIEAHLIWAAEGRAGFQFERIIRFDDFMRMIDSLQPNPRLRRSR